MKKKIVSLLLALAVAMSMLAGCGGTKDTANGTSAGGVESGTEDAGNNEETQEATTEDNTQTSGSTSENAGGTVAVTLLNVFEQEAASGKDVEALATLLSENDVFSEVATLVMPVEEGYLNGFDDEITGFIQGATFAPMIGTIPFVGYIFETEDPDALIETLEAHAMLNWNICTEADEKVVAAKGNLVFFVMAPYSFDQ